MLLHPQTLTGWLCPPEVQQRIPNPAHTSVNAAPCQILFFLTLPRQVRIWNLVRMFWPTMAWASQGHESGGKSAIASWEFSALCHWARQLGAALETACRWLHSCWSKLPAPLAISPETPSSCCLLDSCPTSCHHHLPLLSHNRVYSWKIK